MISKEKLSVYWERFNKILSTMSKIAIVAIAMIMGFVAGNLYEKFNTSLKNRAMQKAHTVSEISVALNERGEMMMVNRRDGSYEIYEDSVGLMIFNLYASKIYYETKK